MTAWDLVRSGETWRLPIEQRSVSRCIVDHAFTLEFHVAEETVGVRIEGAFSVLDQGRIHGLTPTAPIKLGPALGLFDQVVRSATVSVRGKLDIAFEDGRVLTVEHDDDYEPWEIYGPGGMRAVCTPGGTVTVWQSVEAPGSRAPDMGNS